jgi:hypothetical protein
MNSGLKDNHLFRFQDKVVEVNPMRETFSTGLTIFILVRYSVTNSCVVKTDHFLSKVT